MVQAGSSGYVSRDVIWCELSLRRLGVWTGLERTEVRSG